MRKGSKIPPPLLIGLTLLIFLASFIPWKTVGSPQFSARDFKDFRGFVKILDLPAEAPPGAVQMTRFLAPILRANDENWETIRISESKRAQGFLAEKLNDALNDDRLSKFPKDQIFKEKKEAGSASEATKECPQLLKEKRPVYLNRRLLDCAYPTYLNSYEMRASDFFDESDQGFLKGPHDIVDGVRYFIQSQIKTFLGLTLFALIPGVAGLIYRRAFWRWFLAAFAFLFLVNYWFATMDWNYPGKEDADKLEISYGFYLWIELLSVQLLIAFRLRRHSSVAIDARTKRNNVILAVIMILLAVAAAAWARRTWSLSVDGSQVGGAFLQFGGALIALQIAYTLLRQSGAFIPLQIVYAFLTRSVRPGNNEVKQGKNIVVCLDGTWNEPGTTEFGHAAETNVLKLFKMLKGELKQGKSYKQYNSSQCKEHSDTKKTEADTQSVKQIAFYYHGVGNKMENSEFGQVFGGAFGMGASAIVERAYLDVAKVYQQGDRIFIFGFSRGAAIARLLASVVGHRSIPTSMWTLRVFGRNMSIWTSSRKIEDVHNPVKVNVLGCWDTVGSFGISKNIFGIPFQQMNLLKDLTVSLCVKRAYHMVALDETRDAFVPTLMEPDPTDTKRITEVWFSGTHANVGGGYATDQLSDVTLDFLLRHVSSSYPGQPGPEDESWGLYLNAVTKSEAVKSDQVAMHPDLKGPIRHSTGALYSYAFRRVPVHAVINDSVFERMRDTFPVYAPQSLFDLNNELVTERDKVEAEVTKLRETGSLNAEECTEIVEWSRKKLSLMKWSNLDPSERPNPAEELRNPFRGEAIAPLAQAAQ